MLNVLPQITYTATINFINKGEKHYESNKNCMNSRKEMNERLMARRVRYLLIVIEYWKAIKQMSYCSCKVDLLRV